jgi:preprotein translocase subunit YajC
MFALLYFMMIRPQRAQQRKHAEMLGAIKPGDEVVTTGGIYGEIVQLDEERVMLEVDDDVRIAIARSAIASVVPPEELERLEAEQDELEDVDEPKEEGTTAEEPLTAEERTPAR